MVKSGRNLPFGARAGFVCRSSAAKLSAAASCRCVFVRVRRRPGVRRRRSRRSLHCPCRALRSATAGAQSGFLSIDSLRRVRAMAIFAQGGAHYLGCRLDDLHCIVNMHMLAGRCAKHLSPHVVLRPLYCAHWRAHRCDFKRHALGLTKESEWGVLHSFFIAAQFSTDRFAKNEVAHAQETQAHNFY
jgi:hypothetical protein